MVNPENPARLRRILTMHLECHMEYLPTHRYQLISGSIYDHALYWARLPEQTDFLSVNHNDPRYGDVPAHDNSQAGSWTTGNSVACYDDEPYDQETTEHLLEEISEEALDRVVASQVEEDETLLRLRDKKKYKWRDIAALFATRCNKRQSVPALQMRYKRLKIRPRNWDHADDHHLRQAHPFWEAKKWHFISERMGQIDTDRRPNKSWSAASCAAKWEEMRLRSDSSDAA
jgi:hypothetical protein